jgi:hypothetical protein
MMRKTIAALAGVSMLGLATVADAQLTQPGRTTPQEVSPQRPILTQPPGDQQSVDGIVRGIHEEIPAITIEREGAGAGENLQTYAVGEDTNVTFRFGAPVGAATLGDLSVGDEVELQFENVGTGKRQIRGIENRRPGGMQAREGQQPQRTRVAAAGEQQQDDRRQQQQWDQLPATSTPVTTWAAFGGLLALLTAAGLRLAARRSSRGRG